MEEIAIKIDNVSKDFRLPDEKLSSVKSHIVHPFKRRNYKIQHALKDIHVDIKKGEFFGIVGRNGSGKSTLLKIIAGIYQPTAGKVTVAGKLVPFIELGVGFNPELTGKENVYLNGALLGFSKKEIDAQYEDIVNFAELKKFMNQKLKNYSSGMQVRLAFSMAVRANTDILLIDEVLAVGDADFQRKCFEYFKKLKKNHKTVVFVSHNMDAIREYCDRAMLIENSEVVAIGATNTVAEKYSKLFMRNTGSKQAYGASEERWGDMAMKFTNIAVKVEQKEIIITAAVKFNQNLENPIAGFRIRDAAGLDMTGTNTKVENKPLANFKKGQKLMIEWRLPNLFADGTYSVDPSLIYSDGITVGDWWNDAAKFTIRKSRTLPYNIDPGFQISIKEG